VLSLNGRDWIHGCSSSSSSSSSSISSSSSRSNEDDPNKPRSRAAVGNAGVRVEPARGFGFVMDDASLTFALLRLREIYPDVLDPTLRFSHSVLQRLPQRTKSNAPSTGVVARGGFGGGSSRGGGGGGGSW